VIEALHVAHEEELKRLSASHEAALHTKDEEVMKRIDHAFRVGG